MAIAKHLTVLSLICGTLAQSSISQLPITTAVATPSGSSGSLLPSQVPLPPKQAWCPSDIFCAGAVLQTVNLASVYADPKTFVDKPTSKPPQQVLADFAKIPTSGTNEGEIVSFVDSDFVGEGLELEAVSLSNFNANPPFLNNVTDPLLKAWAQTVHGFWTQLIRQTNSTTLCGQGPNATCQSTLIPLNHTFVVPGGRFREQYYWDSFWIVEGLLESQLFDVVNGTLQNFMDELDDFGFIPNGGRIYYLDRSQPPLFIQMLSRYVTVTGDTAILQRALPLAEKELQWWDDNRSINVTSPFTKQTHTMHRYAVTNTAPRPESYLQDYTTANGGSTKLNETQRAELYGELASGAETGWDYTVRWFVDPLGPNNGLQSLNVKNTIPVDLNSILYKNHVALASLYGSSSPSASARHLAAAASIKNGILDLFWDPTKLAFYDFNTVSNARNTIFTTASFYPLWSGIIPQEVLSGPEKAFGVFSSLNLVLNRYNGTFPTTFIPSGQQWDGPNTWPPHQYIILQALRALPANVTGGNIPSPSSGQSTFSLIPSGQLGLNENQLIGQPLTVQGDVVKNSSLTGAAADFNALNGTVFNGGNATSGEGWAQALGRQLANRYIASALCSWHATGGSIPNILPRLSNAELNVTQSTTNTGNMFEKFSALDIDSAGRGGEYTVQAGFGWTNGVVLWISSNYGDVLVAPQCPNLLDTPTGTAGQNPKGKGGAATTKVSFVAVFGILFASALALVEIA